MPPLAIALIQWHPHLGGMWCGVLVLGGCVWMYALYRRLLRRAPPSQVRWLMLPKLLVFALLCVVLFDPVSAIQKSEAVKGKLLVLADSSSSMDVVDDYRESRAARARHLIEQWKRARPADLNLDELEFDTAIHKPGTAAGPASRGTDVAGCLLALSERADLASYMGVVLLTDGGDEAVECAALPNTPLHIVAMGTDPSGWNDLALADAQCPPVAEKDVDFEISAEVQAHAGHGLGFAPRVARARVLLERAAGTNAWEKVLEQPVDLPNLRAQVRLPAKCAQTGIQRYRVTVQPVSGELSTLNNARTLTVNVQKKALRVLYFTRELGQEFKMLRNELGRDPGIALSSLFRTAGDRFTLQGDRLAGDEALAGGLPSTKKGLEQYDAVILGSFPAEECTPRQMQALTQFVEAGGALIFLGGDKSFGRGGYGQTALAALFPWRISDREPEPAHGGFAVRVPPTGLGHPILATIEEVLGRSAATLDSVNQVAELKPGATALLAARLGAREVVVVAVQPFGKGKVMGIASNTLWKWATQPEPLRAAYGLFWRQAIRHLTGKLEGGQNLAMRFDKDYYRPGEQAQGEIRVTTANAEALRFTASLTSQAGTSSVSVEPVPGQTQVFQARLRFRERGEYAFRLVAYQRERVLETFEKNFAVAPLVAEGSRLEVDEPFLKQLAQRGGGLFLRESEAAKLPEQVARAHARKTTVQESSLVEAGPWFVLALAGVLVGEWILRRKMNLF